MPEVKAVLHPITCTEMALFPVSAAISPGSLGIRAPTLNVDEREVFHRRLPLSHVGEDSCESGAAARQGNDRASTGPMVAQWCQLRGGAGVHVR